MQYPTQSKQKVDKWLSSLSAQSSPEHMRSTWASRKAVRTAGWVAAADAGKRRRAAEQAAESRFRKEEEQYCQRLEWCQANHCLDMLPPWEYERSDGSHQGSINE